MVRVSDAPRFIISVMYTHYCCGRTFAPLCPYIPSFIDASSCISSLTSIRNFLTPQSLSRTFTHLSLSLTLHNPRAPLQPKSRYNDLLSFTLSPSTGSWVCDIAIREQIGTPSFHHSVPWSIISQSRVSVCACFLYFCFRGESRAQKKRCVGQFLRGCIYVRGWRIIKSLNSQLA